MTRILVKDLSEYVSKQVQVNGWVENIRFMGKLAFINLRDRSGSIQAVGVKADLDESIWKLIKETTLESVVEIHGVINKRPEAQADKTSETGHLELLITNYELLNKAAPLPIPVAGDGYDINEDARLKYRYLDLRRNRMANVLKLRSKAAQSFRSFLTSKGFTEVETPILTASTKEGSRDFVVPSRINPGKFYALPQSPQQYKQLLMTAGVENYFQLARCIRDENLRADRGFEHTQVDIETSFRTMPEVMDLIEEMIKNTVKEFGLKLKSDPFPRIDYADAIKTYGADKFDMRTEEEKEENVLAFAWVQKFPFFKEVDKEDAAEVEDGKSGWTFTHNPFSMPQEDHIEWHLKHENIEKIVTQQYDLVCNGYEVGGGSIRAHRPEILRATYEIMGYTNEQIESGIGHMLKAFELGTPPHGGIGLGLDRLIMLFANESSLKETIAFPMTYQGRTAVMNGPSELSEEQRKDLGLNSSNDPVQKVLEFLKSKDVEFTHRFHEPTPTSEDAARVRGTGLETGAKALILRGKTSNKNFMFVIPAHLKLDMASVKEILGEGAEFEDRDLIKQKYNLIVGGVHPFGELLDIPTYYDEKLFANQVVNFNSGDQRDSVELSIENFKKLIKAENVKSFSKE